MFDKDFFILDHLDLAIKFWKNRVQTFWYCLGKPNFLEIVAFLSLNVLFDKSLADPGKPLLTRPKNGLKISRNNKKEK